ncbi:MAG: sensor histidine kinase [Bacteroidota bacterium]
MVLNVKQRLRALYAVVVIIAALLLLNVWLMYENSKVIERNKLLQEKAEQVKVGTLDIIRDLHLLDIGLRGYALTRNPGMLSSIDTAVYDQPRIFARLEQSLTMQQFGNMGAFYELRDSVVAYFKLVSRMKELIDNGEQERFLKILNEDRGYPLWLQYKQFSQAVHQFEDDIASNAQANYQSALRNSFRLQWLFFIVLVPALATMAFFTSRAFRVSEELRQVQVEKNRILTEHNEVLDKLVKEKTEDILTQNEEIVAQNEEIRAHNDQLVMQQQQIQQAQQVIEQQSREIQQKNKELAEEVDRQTHDLRQTNLELMEHNSRLQQFTYIISHNLRAPLARLKGLANIMEHSDNQEEKDRIFEWMVQSSQELDNVISDLSTILSIQKSNTLIRSDVNLHATVQKVLALLDAELKQVQAQVHVDMKGKTTIQSLGPYVESIFYNLVSNAIKYRNPERPLKISIEVKEESPFTRIKVADNGLGIDLEKYKANLFNLYKRFHSHVEGKGLGLYLVKTQVEALGGKIEVESKVNEGTSFILHFR